MALRCALALCAATAAAAASPIKNVIVLMMENRWVPDRLCGRGEACAASFSKRWGLPCGRVGVRGRDSVPVNSQWANHRGCQLAMLLLLAPSSLAHPLASPPPLLRAFDHMLGHLHQVDPRIDGLDGTQSNPVTPSDPNSKRVPVAYDAVDGGPFDPKHDFDSITFQVRDRLARLP